MIFSYFHDVHLSNPTFGRIPPYDLHGNLVLPKIPPAQAPHVRCSLYVAQVINISEGYTDVEFRKE